MTTFNFKITNLTCEACIKFSTMALKTIPGVTEIKIDFKSGEAKLVSNQETSWDQVFSALQSVEKNAV
ncbi:MAG: heavy metal-associated domain-containing protein, partial [Candidatus Magasanikbacteria bacterium]|nr:heavy metal-associated domain-containing protein [Candidatus Magasanikbacteria bacterium]